MDLNSPPFPSPCPRNATVGLLVTSQRTIWDNSVHPTIHPKVWSRLRFVQRGEFPHLPTLMHETCQGRGGGVREPSNHQNQSREELSADRIYRLRNLRRLTIFRVSFIPEEDVCLSFIHICSQRLNAPRVIHMRDRLRAGPGILEILLRSLAGPVQPAYARKHSYRHLAISLGDPLPPRTDICIFPRTSPGRRHRLFEYVQISVLQRHLCSGRKIDRPFHDAIV